MGEVPENALPGVTNAIRCQGCGALFKPRRRNQVHCRSGCRVSAWKRRRGLLPAPFTSLAEVRDEPWGDR